MNLKDNFPNIYQLFVGYFSDLSHEDLSDEQIINTYVNDAKKSSLFKKEVLLIKDQIDELIYEIEKFWKVIVLESNIYFDTSEEVKEWLIYIKQLLNTHLSDYPDGA